MIVAFGGRLAAIVPALLHCPPPRGRGGLRPDARAGLDLRRGRRRRAVRQCLPGCRMPAGRRGRPTIPALARNANLEAGAYPVCCRRPWPEGHAAGRRDDDRTTRWPRW